MKINKIHLSWFVACIIFIATVVTIELHIGWLKIVENWQAINTTTILWMVLLTTASYLLRAYRIQFSFNLNFNVLATLFHVSTFHNLANIMLPFRAGEMAFPLLMKRKFGLSIIESTTQLMLFRVLDLLSLLFVACAVFSISMHKWWLLLLLISTVSVTILYADKAKLLLLKWFALRPSTLNNKIHKALSSLPTGSKKFSKMAILTLVIWACKIGAFLGLVLDFPDMSANVAIMAITTADLSSILPIHGFAGTGTFEAAFMLGGAWYNVSSEILLQAALQLHLYLIAMACFSTSVAYIAEKLTTGLFNQKSQFK